LSRQCSVEAPVGVVASLALVMVLC
jgi:hypothetical protein